MHLLNFAIRAVALGVVPHNRRPAAALAWLVAIFFIPVFGVLTFLIFGYANLPHDRARKQAAMVEKARRSELPTPPGEISDAPEWVREAVALNEANGGLPLTAGNRVELHAEYDASLEAMAAAIDDAEHFVHLEFYIIALDTTTEPMFRALEWAHSRGVTVRVLTDHLGSLGYPGRNAAARRLNRAGIPWRWMLPVRPWRFEYQRPDLRNHRKILVIDDRVAFTGSQNLIDASYNRRKNTQRGLQWRDVMLRLEGPVVRQLDAVFIADWFTETGERVADGEAISSHAVPKGERGGEVLCQVLPSGPGLSNENNLRLFTHLFHNARRRIVICSPYLVPDTSLLLAITSAAQRGVDVHLHLGETSNHPLTHHAQRSYYELLLSSGVSISLYKEPIVLHSKFVLIDDDVAVVASSNMDIRSFTLNQEVTLLIIDGDVVRRFERLQDEYRRQSTELGLEQWRRRPLREKYIDNVFRLTSELQ